MAKRQYGKWNPQDMINAIEEYKKGNIGLNKCCEKYNVPKKTFTRHLKGQVKREIQPRISAPVNGRLTALPPEVEEELVGHILKLEELLFGLTINDVRKLAYEILESNLHLKNPFNKEKKIAGKKWYYSFMKRHPNLSLRQPESVSIARCKGFNKTNVHNFFDLLEKIVDDNKIDALTVYNVDESGFSTVQKKSSKILALKGKNQIGALSSGERGVNTTLVACTSASGNFVPPMIIFKRKRMHPALANNAPPGSLVEVSESGYINSDLFVKWLKHFISYVKPTTDNKILLVLDGHTTHSKNLEAINIARENGVLILQLPGHTTHRLQPLDVAIFKPLETFYDQAIIKWMRTNPGRQVTQFEVAGLISEAYEKAATLSNAASGFRATGIWPVDRSVFSETDFIASENLNPTEQERQGNPAMINVNSEVDKDTSNTEEDEAIVNTSTSSKLVVPIDEISPLPTGSKRHQIRQTKGAQKSVILTSSPYKNDLEESKRKQAEMERRRNSKITNNLFSENKSKKRNEKPGPSRKENKKHKPEVSSKTRNIDIVLNTEEWFCFLCGEVNVEDMVLCQVCSKWAHEKCAGYSEKKHSKRSFVCDFCSS